MGTLEHLATAIAEYHNRTGKRPAEIICHPDVWAAWSRAVSDYLIAQPLNLLGTPPTRRAVWGIPVRLDPAQPPDGYTLSPALSDRVGYTP